MPLLHASPGSVLNQFTTRRPDLYAALAFPFYHTIGGKTCTMVGDGETVLLWTARRLPGYRDWLSNGGPPGFYPAEWTRHFLHGAAYPLPPLTAKSKKPVRMVVTGHAAFIPRRLAEALRAFDTCYIDIPGGMDRSGNLPAVSVSWTLGSITGCGLIFCEKNPQA